MGLFKKKANTAHGRRKLYTISEQSSFGYVEAYKMLRTNLNYTLKADGNGKVIMVTSSVPAEGKSNVSINLAITLAQSEKKVILLDCDMRKGMLQRYLRIPRRMNGIVGVLQGEVPLKEAIIQMQDEGFALLSVEMIPPNPTELLESVAMGKMLNELANQFDYVICDTPPVTSVVDASILSPHVDGAVLVVSHNQVARDSVLAAKAQLENTNTNILGVVLNMYDARRSGVSGRREYSYYNYGYYNSYGYGEKNESNTKNQ